MSKILTVIVLSVVFFILPQSVSAHAFGQNYTLPLPVWLYLWGGSSAIIISFFLIAFFFRNSSSGSQKSFLELKIPNSEAIYLFTFFARIVFSLLFIIVILAGLFGSQSPAENIAPVLFWILFYLGITYISALFGSFWNFINPICIL